MIDSKLNGESKKTFNIIRHRFLILSVFCRKVLFSSKYGGVFGKNPEFINWWTTKWWTFVSKRFTGDNNGLSYGQFYRGGDWSRKNIKRALVIFQIIPIFTSLFRECSLSECASRVGREPPQPSTIMPRWENDANWLFNY